jgi:hypothetical protein
MLRRRSAGSRAVKSGRRTGGRKIRPSGGLLRAAGTSAAHAPRKVERHGRRSAVRDPTALSASVFAATDRVARSSPRDRIRRARTATIHEAVGVAAARAKPHAHNRTRRRHRIHSLRRFAGRPRVAAPPCRW